MKFVFALILISLGSAPALAKPSSPAAFSNDAIQQLDELHAVWSAYRHHFIDGGRVIARDENGITTSEGQSYALLRSVWAEDGVTFERVWAWTQRHLQVRRDKLFAWKWEGRVSDLNSASDADVDIALALILASRKFEDPAYLQEARNILKDIWEQEVVTVGGDAYLLAGPWAKQEKAIIHVGYLAPHAYEVFAGVDNARPWAKLVQSSYSILNWIYFEKNWRVPPKQIAVDMHTGLRSVPASGADFGYDNYPLFWRLAVDERWHGRNVSALKQKIFSFFEQEWKKQGRIFESYSTAGRALSSQEAPTLYAVLAAWARPDLAQSLFEKKLAAPWRALLRSDSSRYYLSNWLWFSRAFQLQKVRSFDEILSFLRPFDYRGFSQSFPWWGFAILVGAYLAQHFTARAKYVCLVAGIALCVRYLYWRWTYTLNFMEMTGPVVSLALWLAELYCFSTILFLCVQCGIRRKKTATPALAAEDPAKTPTVDIFIPIYSESLAILEKTLLAAKNIDYPLKKIYVCDDSHREEVRALAEANGAGYIRGPKKHAKAGNLNHAIPQTTGELLVVFDTDHIPTREFLRRTVPHFAHPQMGMVQTPHHFYNEDIFQRALLAGHRVPNEQDMFNHGIQSARDSWGGAFFVGSGAIFRRSAILSVGGFKLLSITEDIHTSQHLHSKGWKSAFVDEDLAFGLAAENLSSHIVQRRRWMLGCLQIFLKDNPLWQRGLSLRMRLGYFASLYYFFFPLTRVIFFVAPLCFLLFHWHPIFADVSVLLGYLVPFFVAMPLMTKVLLPGWPRFFWGTAYEMVLAFPLFRSMADLFLPKSLGFKVTPKGITSARRQFDAQSGRITLIALMISGVAIGKGLFEFYYFGIEKDAYFFNLIWATLNFLFLAVAVLVAWERPQRREEDRLPFSFSTVFSTPEGFSQALVSHDISLSGMGFRSLKPLRLPPRGNLKLLFREAELELPVEIVYEGKQGSRYRTGLRFTGLSVEQRERLIVETFGNAENWKLAHARHPRSEFGMATLFLAGLIKGLFASRPPRALRSRRRFFLLPKETA